MVSGNDEKPAKLNCIQVDKTEKKNRLGYNYRDTTYYLLF